MAEPYTIDAVTEREYVAVPTDGWGWFLSNSGWVVGDDTTLVVDTAVSERRTTWLRGSLAGHRRRHDARGPVVVVLTHAHGDHANGAYQFEAQGSAVLAAHGAADEIQLGVQRFPGILADTPWGDVRMPSTVQVVDADRTIDLGGVRVTIRPCPRVAHTRGDVTVSTSDGVLWAGDLVWNAVTPFAAQGSVDGWLATLDELDAEGHRTVVPGHGPAAGPAIIGQTRDFLRWVQAVATTAIRGSTTAQAALADDPRSGRPWHDWPCGERDVVNVMRSMAERRGAVFDFAAGIAAMMGVYGGQLTAPG